MLILELLFYFFQFLVAQFLDFTTTSEVEQAVSVWHASKKSPHNFLNWDEFALLSFKIEILTQDFLEPSHVVAMACVDLNLKEIFAWISFSVS